MNTNRTQETNVANLVESVKGGWYRANQVRKKIYTKTQWEIETFGNTSHS